MILLISVYEPNGKVCLMTFNLIAAIKTVGLALIVFGGVALMIWVGSLISKLGCKYFGRLYGGDILVVIYCIFIAGVITGFIIP